MADSFYFTHSDGSVHSVPYARVHTSRIGENPPFPTFLWGVGKKKERDERQGSKSQISGSNNTKALSHVYEE